MPKMSANQEKQTDATEDDDFGDFEGPEDDAPESVQAMAAPPNWVFPGWCPSRAPLLSAIV
ncbi:unnamed protein product, partial [Oppiella nova]